MKKIFLTTICALAFAGCGDDGGDPPVVKTVDAGGGGTTADAAPACNPATKQGCAAGEKCAQLVASDEPFLASTACVKDGTVAVGGACERGEAGATGFDDCVSGAHCLRGICTEVCTSAGGDTCRTAEQAFGEGSYCTMYADLYTDEIGLCNAGCIPSDDTTNVEKMSVVHNTCPAENGCYLNLGRMVAACAGVPGDATEKEQNEDCYGPQADSCFLNGCDIGYAPMIPNAVGMAATNSSCVRYCTPVDSYKTAATMVNGSAGKCASAALSQAGSSGLAVANECRFLNSFYSDTAELASTVGVCIPVDPWTTCSDFEWVGMRDAVMAAADQAAANAAFNTFCYGVAEPADNAELDPKCLPLFRGCLDNATTVDFYAKLDGPAASPARKSMSAARRGQQARINAELKASL